MLFKKTNIDKNKLKYVIMIKQPDFLQEIFDLAIKSVREKKA